MKVRFQADADLNEDIVSGVLRRVPEIDFQTANEAELESLTILKSSLWLPRKAES